MTPFARRLAGVFVLALAGRRCLSPSAGIFFDGLVRTASLDNLLMCALLAVAA